MRLEIGKRSMRVVCSRESFVRCRAGDAAMTLRPLLCLVVSLMIAGVTWPAAAATKDAATLKKIDEAIGTHFPAGKYQKAESVLQAAIKACGPKTCSGEVLAKAHVALGVVRGKASKDLSGARKAFERAKKADSNAMLDSSLVAPEVAVEFYKVMGRELPKELARSTGSGAPVGNLHCTPASGYEIQTAQPIAVVCDPLEGVVRAELHYRFGSAPDYTAILMSVQDGTLRANIPCEPLTKPGKLEVYIVAQDFNKERIDSFGSVSKPAHYDIVQSTKDPVPSYPGQDPPKRCQELLAGGASQGEHCTATQPCKRGLYCAEGICQIAPSCETDSDCESASCNNGYCEMAGNAPEVESAPNQWMVGIHGAFDLWLAPRSKSVCGEASLRAGDFFCYNSGEERLYRDTSAKSNRIPMTDPNSGNVDPGFRPATARVMASVDYVLKSYLSVGVRLGWAFLGGPRAVKYDSAGIPSRKAKFIPFHAEARGTLWLRSLGKPGLHPYVHLSAGMADVDANTPIVGKLNGTSRKLDAWRRMGPAFAGGGFGALYDINKTFGVQLNLNAMYLFPATGLVLEPSLGGVMGF
jgi:hypothetical protein